MLCVLLLGNLLIPAIPSGVDGFEWWLLSVGADGLVGVVVLLYRKFRYSQSHWLGFPLLRDRSCNPFPRRLYLHLHWKMKMTLLLSTFQSPVGSLFFERRDRFGVCGVGYASFLIYSFLPFRIPPLLHSSYP